MIGCKAESINDEEIDDTAKDDLQKFITKCEMYCAKAKIVAEPKNEEGFADAIKNSPAGTCAPTHESKVVAFCTGGVRW